MTKDVLIKVGVYGVLYAVTTAIVLSVVLMHPSGENRYPVLRDVIIFFATVLLTKYFFYMTVSPWYDVVIAKRRARDATTYAPLVSVVVPAWNEEVGLTTTVRSLLESTYRNLEIVVVNDGSTDASDALMRKLIKKHDGSDIRIVYEYQENGGKGRALNRGIALSKGEIIISIDADCSIPPASIGNFVAHFKDPSVMAAVGNVKIGNTKTLLGTLQYLEFLFSFYFKKCDSLLNTIYIIGGAAGAFRRSVFTEVGEYNPKNITEDIDLSVRIQDKGMRIVYAADAVVYTEGATTIDGLMKQRLRWKRGRFQTFSEHRHLFFSTKPGHNKFLTWLVLPLALFGDTQLFFELFFLGFLYLYSMAVGDFSSFVSGVIVVSAMFAVQIFDDRAKTRPEMYLLAPVGWLLFYITTVVEYNALLRSMWGIATGKKIRWQRWKRAGIAAEIGILGKETAA
jgi:cellulose synthase/poly-beta-1,6-N-acetylglucosamine synthase-like glycosyltransferase